MNTPTIQRESQPRISPQNKGIRVVIVTVRGEAVGNIALIPNQHAAPQKPAGTAAHKLLKPLSAVMGHATMNTKMPNTIKLGSGTFKAAYNQMNSPLRIAPVES